jgi:MYXO-CTERM domain-containing protein
MAMTLLLSAAAAPRTAWAVASAELYTMQAYFYGRFEARIRFAPGDGIVGSFFLWKDGSDRSGAFWNELDYEKVAADCHMTTNARYGAPFADHSQTNPLNVDICGSYHDYRFEWTPDYIAWAVDGREFRRETGATATAFRQNATAGMQIHFNVWPGNADFGGNFNASILPVHEYISWVQYSSFANGTFTPQWKEEFAAATLPTGWVLGNFGSPFNLSVHNPSDVSFVNGIAVLSVTADNATGAPGVPPPDPSAAGGTGGAGATGAGGAGAGGAGGAGAGGPDAGAGRPDAGADGMTGGSGGVGPGSGGSSPGTGGGTGAGGSPGLGGGGTGGSMMPGSGGHTSTGMAGAGASNSSSSGCSCNLGEPSGGGGPALALILVVLSGVARRRRSGAGAARASTAPRPFGERTA